MKVLKSLILGAAAICAVSWGAQAADLPLKAKPVEYVKICSAYGAGFYYIPGTDICLRVGGYLWYDLNFSQRGEGADIGNVIQNNNYGALSTRGRAVFIMDARTATQYGTLRSYAAFGLYWTSCGNAVTAAANIGGGAGLGCTQTYASGATGAAGDVSTYIERAFVQFAGFTFGYVGSFFDFAGTYSMASLNTLSFKYTTAAAYTIQYGNGLSTTLAMEDPTPRRNQIGGCVSASTTVGYCFAGPLTNAFSTANIAGGLLIATGYGGAQAPVIVWNARVDQAWGSAQVSVAGHELKVDQYLALNGIRDAWGWAVLGGIEVKVPSGPGDSIMLQGVFGSGAAEFTGLTNFPVLTFNSVGTRNAANNGTIFDTMDSIVNAATGRQDLVDMWSINAQYRHFWNPMLRTAIFGGLNQQNMPASATALNYPDLRLWQAGVNTIWSPVKDLDLGVEIIYTNIQTTCAGCAVVVSPASASTPVGAGTNAVNNASTSVISGMFRARRNW